MSFAKWPFFRNVKCYEASILFNNAHEVLLSDTSREGCYPIYQPELIDFRMTLYYSRIMTKEKLIGIIQGILGAEVDLSFLLQLKKSELETLVACIRARIDQSGK